MNETDFAEVEKLCKKSKLTQKDVDRLSAKVNRAAGLHAQKLLAECKKEKSKMNGLRKEKTLPQKA